MKEPLSLSPLSDGQFSGLRRLIRTVDRTRSCCISLLTPIIDTSLDGSLFCWHFPFSLIRVTCLNKCTFRYIPTFWHLTFSLVAGKGWIGQQQHHQPVSSSSFQQRTSSTSLVTTSSSDNNQRLTNLLLTKQMVEPPSRPHSFWDEPLYKPQFDESLPRNITAQLGRTVHLPCRIRQLADRTVSTSHALSRDMQSVEFPCLKSDEMLNSLWTMEGVWETIWVIALLW